MTKTLDDYTNSFNAIEDFEKALADFAGAPGAIVFDSFQNAVEVGLRYRMPKMYATIPARIRSDIPVLLKKLGITFIYDDAEWDKMYQIKGSIVYDSSRYFEREMFERDLGQSKIICVSFENGSPLDIGVGAAILTNARAAHDFCKKESREGKVDMCMAPKDAVAGLNKLTSGDIADLGGSGYKYFSDLSAIED